MGSRVWPFKVTWRHAMLCSIWLMYQMHRAKHRGTLCHIQFIHRDWNNGLWGPVPKASITQIQAEPLFSHSAIWYRATKFGRRSDRDQTSKNTHCLFTRLHTNLVEPYSHNFFTSATYGMIFVVLAKFGKVTDHLDQMMKSAIGLTHLHPEGWV